MKYHLSDATRRLSGALMLASLCATTVLAAPSQPLNVAALEHDRILRAAEKALVLEPITITRFKAKLSEGGPNDFYSNGDYWWPDPAKPDGLPYIQRDGESNPNNFRNRSVV